MAFRALLILLLLIGGAFPAYHCSNSLLRAAVYVKQQTPAGTGTFSPGKAERYFKYRQLKRWSRKMLKWLLYVSLAWTLLYLSFFLGTDRTAPQLVAIFLFGLMAIAGIILLLLFFAWLRWLLSSLWGWLFPNRLHRKLSKCYEW